MRTFAFVVAVTSVLGASPALAEDCKKSEKLMLAAMRTFDKMGQVGVDLTAQCMFRGTDAKAVAKLTTTAKTAFASLASLRDPAPACIKVGDVASTFRTIGQSAGQRIGLAYALCSAKVQAHAAKRTQEGATLEVIKAEVGKMAEAWLGDLMK
jgi:hypothetical protein